MLRSRLYHYCIPLLLCIAWSAKSCELIKEKQSGIAESKALAIEAMKQDKAKPEDVLTCLADQDPKVRDTITYTALSDYLRGLEGSSVFVSKMHQSLVMQLNSEMLMSPWQFSFYILALSETTRLDRVHPYLMKKQRQQLVDLTETLFWQVNSYEGYTEETGWIHQTAHASDLVLQLALNPKTTKEQLNKLGDALLQQMDAKGLHSYIHGESDRLARALTYLMVRPEVEVSHWRAYIKNLSNPPSRLGSWQNAYESKFGLAVLHNRQLFLSR